MPYLSDIEKPSDLRSFNMKELDNLAEEIRHRIMSVLSVTGGHLASNLGIVELTIALHYVFNSPKDKFIFDVSHQSYVHKLLTGRNPRFDQIRQFKGLCGFCHPKESEHDHFYAGHAGTAFSLGLGVAKARDLVQNDDHVIPILGDASLTCGLTLEALNNVPSDLSRFITILNDNDMSISNSVGNIKNILSRLLSNPVSNKIYDDLKSLVSKLPGYGPKLAKQGQKIRESIKNLVSSATFFEEFGLSYVGPINGHDTRKMIDTFTRLKDVQHPVLVHVITKKGKGMAIAAENPISYHGVKPFDKNSGKFLPNPSPKATFPKIFGDQMLKMADSDNHLMAVTPAMPAGSCLTPFMKKYPDRCLDVGIAEGHCVTFAGGLAKNPEVKVVASVYATFLQRALDNVFHDVCLQELPVVFALDRAGLSGPDGSTHHGIYDIGFLNEMPNMIIAQPRNGQILRELLSSCFEWKRPTAIRYPNLATEDETKNLKVRKLGKGELLQKGNQILLISLGHMAETALETAEILKKDGLNPTVLDPIFLKPLDDELLAELLSTHPFVVTIEEHSIHGGLGSIINSYILRNKYSNQVYNFAVPDTFVQHGKTQDLLQELELDAKSIARKILAEFDLTVTAEAASIES